MFMLDHQWPPKWYFKEFEEYEEQKKERSTKDWKCIVS